MKNGRSLPTPDPQPRSVGEFESGQRGSHIMIIRFPSSDLFPIEVGRDALIAHGNNGGKTVVAGDTVWFDDRGGIADPLAIYASEAHFAAATRTHEPLERSSRFGEDLVDPLSPVEPRDGDAEVIFLGRLIRDLDAGCPGTRIRSQSVSLQLPVPLHDIFVEINERQEINSLFPP